MAFLIAVLAAPETLVKYRFKLLCESFGEQFDLNI